MSQLYNRELGTRNIISAQKIRCRQWGPVRHHLQKTFKTLALHGALDPSKDHVATYTVRKLLEEGSMAVTVSRRTEESIEA